MDWLVAMPGFAGALAILLIPGLFLGWALGLRHIWMISLSPVLTTSLVAVSTVAFWWLRIPWNVGSFAVGAAILVGTVLFAAPMARKRWPANFSWSAVEDKPDRGYWLAVLAAVALLSVRYLQIVEHPGNINQGIDTPFHVNLVREIVNTGNGSPFAVRSLMGESTGLYPQIWHALAALTTEAMGLPIIEAANALNLAIVAVAWPLGVLLLVHLVVGPKIVGLLFAAVASAGFFAFPFTVLQSQKSDFGPLFPYMLGVALLPPLVAVIATAWRFGKGSPLPRALAATTLVIAIPGLVLTHMSGLVALVGLSSIFAIMAALRSFRTLKQGKSDLFGYLKWTALWISLFSSGLVIWAVVRPWTTTWDPIDSFPAAAGSILLNAPTHGSVAWGLAALSLIGTLLLVTRPTEWWFLASYVGALGLYVVAAAVPYPVVRQIVIGAWYGDPPRLAALLPMFWAVFAGVAGAWIYEATSQRRIQWIVLGGVAAVAASIIIWPTNSETTLGREHTYALAEASPLLSPDELELLNRLGDDVPADAVMANNPWNGSSTAYAISNRRVLFAHAYTGSNKDRLLVAQRLNQASPESEVCAAARRENVRFLLDFGDQYIDPKRTEVNDFPGLDGAASSPAFVRIDQQGAAVLYRFVGCGI